jgi:hypothetical protein
LQLNDEGSAFAEAGRVQLFDENGNLLLEELFHASSVSGGKQVTVEFAEGFHSLALTAGAYNGTQFVGGAYAAADGSFGAAPAVSGGQLRGSDFLVHAAEFQLVGGGAANAVDFFAT